MRRRRLRADLQRSRGPAGTVFRIAAPRRPRNVSKAHAKWAQGASFSMRFACGDPSQRGLSFPDRRYRSGVGGLVGRWQSAPLRHHSVRSVVRVVTRSSPSRLAASSRATLRSVVVELGGANHGPRGWSRCHQRSSSRVPRESGPRWPLSIPTIGNGTQWRRTSTKVHEREPGGLPGEGPQCHRSRREQAQGCSFGVAGAMPS